MPDLRLYPFELPAGGNALFARFPFIFEGRQMPEISCALSLSAAGTMALDTGQPQNLSAARRAFF
jgi:hypothetical protein